MSEIPECPRIEGCVCYSDGQPCVCGLTEKALRGWVGGKLPPMTLTQRNWCLDEIDSVEGYNRADWKLEDDLCLARGVLSAWSDYAKDKGLL